MLAPWPNTVLYKLTTCKRNPVLKGSWDMVTRVINKVTILKVTYIPI